MDCQQKELSRIDEQIRELHALSVQDGLCKAEILKATKVFLPGKTTVRWDRQYLWYIGKVVLAVAVLFAVFSRDAVSRRMCMYGRTLLISLLPYWDWTAYHHSPCLIENPLYVERGLSLSDCQVCEDTLRIDRVKDASPDTVLDKYFGNYVPLVVQGPQWDWPSFDASFVIENITKKYAEDPVLKDAAICGYQTNRKHWAFDTFVEKHSSETGWFAHWENCDGPGQKHARQFYRRPPFLPLAVELTRPNWILVSNLYRGRRFKQITFESGSSIVLLAQLKGSLAIRLLPPPICEQVCENMEFVLNYGDILLFAPRIWTLQYMPRAETQTIAVAAGGFLEE
ncbi:uncharacterized protein LOC135371040 [Ornithodoros turicata]|uniref:uncharacterized protein LOC135371040 n=1 Tax=Ornithodoros turicata TaxID=34597 RepID=UPI0031397D32